MNHDFEHRVHAAAMAGWWTLLIAMLLVTAQWLAYLACARSRPEWLMEMWGPNISWPEIERMWIGAILTFKLAMLLPAMVVVWLTLWSRQLRKAIGA